MDETEEEVVVTVGQRLKEAREASGLSVEDIAAQTRIPTRHLISLEDSDWDKLPAATYSVGFAKNYAGAVGLDRTEIGDALRSEMGGTRPAYAQPEVYEAADPARTMPKGLVFGALALLVVVVLGLSWLSNRSMQADEPVAEAANVAAPAQNAVVPDAAPAVNSGPVVLTANAPVWIQVKDGGATLKEGVLTAGERFEVPANATAPVLTTGKPEALHISVGTTDAPAIGPAGQRVSGVSLRAADLQRGSAVSAPAPSTPAQATPTLPRSEPRATQRRSVPAPPPVEAPNSGASAETNATTTAQ